MVVPLAMAWGCERAQQLEMQMVVPLAEWREMK
jgi:hypothetical protein